VTLQITATPQHARITVDGRACPRPCRARVAPGRTVVVEARAKGYAKQLQRVTASTDKAIDLALKKKPRSHPDDSVADEDFLPGD